MLRPLVKATDVPVLFTFHDTVPCDLSDLREQQEMDLYLPKVYMSSDCFSGVVVLLSFLAERERRRHRS